MSRGPCHRSSEPRRSRVCCRRYNIEQPIGVRVAFEPWQRRVALRPPAGCQLLPFAGVPVTAGDGVTPNWGCATGFPVRRCCPSWRCLSRPCFWGEPCPGASLWGAGRGGGRAVPSQGACRSRGVTRVGGHGCLCCPSREGFHDSVVELLVLPQVAARLGLLMRSRERREGTCSGTHLATCPTSPGERRVPLLAAWRGGTLHGAGGDKEGGLRGPHRGDMSGCPTWWASRMA